MLGAEKWGTLGQEEQGRGGGWGKSDLIREDCLAFECFCQRCGHTSSVLSFVQM